VKRYVALVGFMASGKSTIGRGLARRLGCAFFDTDEIVVGKHGAVAQIFAAQGEAAFRQYEREALHEALSGAGGGVVALGGGALVLEENRALVEERAHRVFIKLSPESVRGRLQKSREVRPVLGRAPSLAQVVELYDRRFAQYAAADCVVDADGINGEQAVDAIVTWLRAKKIEIGP